MAGLGDPRRALRFAGDTGRVTSLDSSPYTYEAPVSAELFDRGQRDHAGRGEQPGAGLRRRRRHAPVHGRGLRSLDHRRRRTALRRPGRLLGSADPRARAPRRRRGRHRRRPARALLRRPHRGRARPGRGDPRPDGAGRAGAAGQLRHRGRAVGRAAGPRRDRPAAGREVRRLLPRARRRAAGLGRLRRRDPRACPTPPASPPAPPPTPSSCPTTTSPRSRRSSPSAATEIACVISEAAAGQHGRRPAAGRLQRRRCAGSPPRTARC